MPAMILDTVVFCHYMPLWLLVFFEDHKVSRKQIYDLKKFFFYTYCSQPVSFNCDIVLNQFSLNFQVQLLSANFAFKEETRPLLDCVQGKKRL